MDVHVFSAGQTPRQDYSLEGVSCPAISRAIGALETTGLTLNEDGEDLAFLYQVGDRYVVFLNNCIAHNVSDRPLDYQRRYIRASVAWSLETESDARGLFRYILECFKARKEEMDDVISGRILKCIQWDKEIPRGYDWDSECLVQFVAEIDKSADAELTLQSAQDIWSAANHDGLCGELAQKRFPDGQQGFLCIVANQKARSAFQNANVWRSLTLGYETKPPEASKMPGESRFGTRTLKGCLAAFFALSLIGYVILTDRTAPTVTEVKIEDLHISLGETRIELDPGAKPIEVLFVFDEPVSQVAEIELPDWVIGWFAPVSQFSNELRLNLRVDERRLGNGTKQGVLVLSGVKDEAGNEMPPEKLDLTVK